MAIETREALSQAEVDLCIKLLAEMHYAGRQEEEVLLRKIMKRSGPQMEEILYDEPWSEDD